MRASSKRARLGLISLMVCGALFLSAPAIAQTVLGTFTTNASGSFSGTVTIPTNTTPGIYDLTAAGLGPLVSPYPPTSTGSLAVSSTVVAAGQSITVSGGGFAANTPVVVALSFVASAEAGFEIAQTNTLRVLRARIRVVAADAVPGAGAGNVIINNDNRVSCVSNATATADAGTYKVAQAGDININNENTARCESTATAVKNIEQKPVTQPVTRVLARTGVDALPLLAAAIATILLGSVLLSAGRRRGHLQGSFRTA